MEVVRRNGNMELCVETVYEYEIVIEETIQHQERNERSKIARYLITCSLIFILP